MKIEDTKKLLNYINENRESFIFALDSCINYLEVDTRLKLENDLLKKLILDILYKEFYKGKQIADYCEFFYDLPDSLLSKLDLSELNYEKLKLDEAALNIMKKTNILLNPQGIYQGKLNCKNFAGISFKGNFDECDIRYSNFTGSKGAIIDIAAIKNNDIDGVNFADTIVINLTKSINLNKANFENAIIKYKPCEETVLEKLKLKNNTLYDARIILEESTLENDVQSIITKELKKQLKQKR